MQTSTPVLPITIVSIVTGALIALTIWITRHFSRKPLSAESHCGQCGYIVKGLTSMTCPECGSDLREVGIISASKPGHRSIARSLKIVAALIVWTFLCLFQFSVLWRPWDPHTASMFSVVDGNL